MTPPRKLKTSLAAPEVQSVLRHKALYDLAPWTAKHYETFSEIEAYVMAAGEWQVIAEVNQTAGASAEEMAEYIVHTVNNFDKAMDLLDDMISALEACFESKGLDWSAEFETDIALRRARAMKNPGSSSDGNE